MIYVFNHPDIYTDLGFEITKNGLQHHSFGAFDIQGKEQDVAAQNIHNGGSQTVARHLDQTRIVVKVGHIGLGRIGKRHVMKVNRLGLGAGGCIVQTMRVRTRLE